MRFSGADGTGDDRSDPRMPPQRAARAASGCRAPGDSRHQTLDDTSAGIGANQVHRRAASEGAEIPVQPASGLVPVGEGPLGDCQAPRHASGASGLVDRKPAAVRPPVRQSTWLDDEGAQFTPGDAALRASIAFTLNPAATARAISASETPPRRRCPRHPRGVRPSLPPDWLTMLRRIFILADVGHVIRDGVDPQREHEHLGMGQPERKYQTYPGYRWVVCHPDLLGGRPTVIGTRISLSQVLECLSDIGCRVLYCP